MSADMRIDLFAEQPYGKIALSKLGEVSENFRLYYAGWVGHPMGNGMNVRGAEFREPLRGKNKGKLSILVKGTEQSVYLSRKEMQDYDLHSEMVGMVDYDL